MSRRSDQAAAGRKKKRAARSEIDLYQSALLACSRFLLPKTQERFERDRALGGFRAIEESSLGACEENVVALDDDGKAAVGRDSVAAASRQNRLLVRADRPLSPLRFDPSASFTKLREIALDQRYRRESGHQERSSQGRLTFLIVDRRKKKAADDSSTTPPFTLSGALPLLALSLRVRAHLARSERERGKSRARLCSYLGKSWCFDSNVQRKKKFCGKRTFFFPSLRSACSHFRLEPSEKKRII